ncbi:hypothetical protein PAEVO_26010 [Paenibacillus sp. GM2FR]|jgi:hypothetical protein|nr:hypothetical protein PAEVO_26010 [Paenibacillus sp. GM2FR]
MLSVFLLSWSVFCDLTPGAGEVFLVTQELSTSWDRLYNNGTYTLDIHTEEDERIWSVGRL